MDKEDIRLQICGEIPSLVAASMALIVSGQLLKSAAIDLERSGRLPHRLWSLDERFRVVSKSEYVAIFGE